MEVEGMTGIRIRGLPLTQDKNSEANKMLCI